MLVLFFLFVKQLFCLVLCGIRRLHLLEQLVIHGEFFVLPTVLARGVFGRFITAFESDTTLSVSLGRFESCREILRGALQHLECVANRRRFAVVDRVW